MQAPLASQNKILSPDSWVDKYADYLYSYAYMRVSGEEVARDLVQDTFLSALKAKNSFKGEASEKTWLVSILKRKIIDHYRRNAVRKESPFEESDAYKAAYGHYFTEKGFMPGDWNRAHAPRAWNAGERSRIEEGEFRKILQACLARLPRVWAAVFTMKHIDEASSQTICKELDISASNFWVIIHRAKLQMRECLEKNWFKA